MLNRREFLQAAALGGTAIGLVGCGSAAGNDAATPVRDTDAAATTEPVAVRTAALKGPTAMGLVRFMSEADAGNLADEDWSFQILASADEVAPLIAKSEVDIATVPANLASVLYNKTGGDIVTLAINTLGVLYVVENGNAVQSMADLTGKTIVASGKGSTPEYALRYLLTENGLNPDADVVVDWKSEHSECVAALASGAATVALLPQPFVTVAQSKMPDLRVALDLTEEWDKLDNGSALLTGVVVARKDFVEEHPTAVATFLEDYGASVSWVNENTADAAELIAGYGIVDSAAVAEKALPYCNIVCITGAEMKEKLSGYLQVLFDADPASVGADPADESTGLPGDDFYYGA